MKLMLASAAIALGLCGCIKIVQERSVGFDSNNGPIVEPSGAFKTEHRSVGPFHGVEVGSIVQLEYAKGQSPTVAVQAQQSVLPVVKTVVKDGILRVDVQAQITGPVKVLVTVTNPSLHFADISGAAQAHLVGIASPTLTINASGTASVDIDAVCQDLDSTLEGGAKLSGRLIAKVKSKIDVSGTASADLTGPSSQSADIQLSGDAALKLDGLDTNKLVVSASGTGTAQLQGHASTAQLNADGSASLKLSDVTIDDCQAEASGSSQVSVAAKNTLRAEAGGASSIQFSGDPELQPSTSGVGSVRRM